jgi:hypothetical protein
MKGVKEFKVINMAKAVKMANGHLAMPGGLLRSELQLRFNFPCRPKINQLVCFQISFFDQIFDSKIDFNRV